MPIYVLTIEGARPDEVKTIEEFLDGLNENLLVTVREAKDDCTTKCKHSGYCICPSPKVKEGDRIRDRLTGRIGDVRSVQAPNMPWHHGGTPFVHFEDGSTGYCHYYDLAG